LAYQNNLKKILNEEQFEKWTKTNHHRKDQMKKKHQRGMGQNPPNQK
jgi:heme-degrading monooxygenase HmoA